MSALTFHIGDWTLADLEKLPDDGNRYEIVDGSLHVTPPPSLMHLSILSELQAVLRASAPADTRVLSGAGVTMARSFLIPDLLVVKRTTIRSGTYVDPSEVLLAIEVVSPSSRTHDRSTERPKYAEVGIPHYWIVELDPMRLRVLRLRNEAYEETFFDRQVAVNEPFRVVVDVDALPK